VFYKKKLPVQPKFSNIKLRLRDKLARLTCILSQCFCRLYGHLGPGPSSHFDGESRLVISYGRCDLEHLMHRADISFLLAQLADIELPGHFVLKKESPSWRNICFLWCTVPQNYKLRPMRSFFFDLVKAWVGVFLLCFLGQIVTWQFNSNLLD